jgi:ribosomal protein S6
MSIKENSMTRNYDGLFILNTAGKEETSKDLVEKLEKDIQQAGGKTNKIERLDKRTFARIAGNVDSGYYVNIGFEMAPEKLVAFRDKLKLDEDVFRVIFFKTEEGVIKSVESKEKKNKAKAKA